MNHTAFHYVVYHKAVRPEPAFLIRDLTFLYISFAEKFCQKKVKKNCKSACWVFFKGMEIWRDDKHGKHVPAVGCVADGNMLKLHFMHSCNNKTPPHTLIYLN